MVGRGSLVTFCVAFVVLVAACGNHQVAQTSDHGGAGCSGVPASPGGDLRVATSVAPITNIVSVIAGGTNVHVVGLVPEGVDSHTFSPAPDVAATLEQADVVVLNGLGLEAPLREMALANSAGVLCELGDETLPPGDYIFDVSFPEAAGRPNPHLWTNPPMVRTYAALVRDVLAAVDPASADRYGANFERFAEQIDRLDVAVRAASESIPADDRLLLTYHDAYAYFAADYGWTIVGAVQPASFSEPTPREVARLVDQIEASGVAAIFGSEVFPSPVLRQLAAETGAIYVDDLRDDDLPGDPGDADHSWLGLMRHNLTVIVDALGGDSTPLRALELTPFAPDRATYP